MYFESTNKIGKISQNTTAYSTHIKYIKKSLCVQLYVNKLKNLDRWTRQVYRKIKLHKPDTIIEKLKNKATL